MLFALTGALGLAAIALSITQTADHANREDGRQAAQAYERSRRIESYRNCHQLTGVERLFCEDQAARRAHEGQRDEQNVAANKKVALWTKATGIVAILAVVFNVVTIIAALLVYFEQRNANRIQFLNFSDARRRARQNLAHAEGVSHQELRPYVFVDKIVSEQLHERVFQIVVWFRNFGRTPARNVEAIVSTYVTRDLHRLKKLKPRADKIDLGTAAPDGSRRAFAPLVFSKQQWESGVFDRAYGVIRIKYTYSDGVGENEFAESIDFYTYPGELAKDEPMFYLLNDQRIQLSKRRQSQEGDMIDLMRSGPKRHKTGHKPKHG